MLKEERPETLEEQGILFNQILKEAMGISDQAAEAFKVLLTLGPLTLGEISTNSGLGYALSTKAVLELESERLVRRIPGVLSRFTTIPPYAGFVAFLKDFQKIAKNLGDSTTSAVDSALTTVSKNCGDWKKEAQQAAKSSIQQTVSEIDLYKSSSSKNVTDMLEKLKQETELTKTMVTDSIKKHVDEHKIKSTEVEAELASGIDNVNTKLDTSAKKYLKDTTDMMSAFLENYRGTVQTFAETVHTNLQQYKTDIRENLIVLENEISSIEAKLEEKARSTITSSKTKSSDVLESQRKSFGEKSLELQSGIRDVTDRFMKAASTNLGKFKSSVDGAMKEFSVDLGKTLSEFKEKTTASLDKWWSNFKTGINDSTQLVYRNIDVLVNSITREGESLNSLVQGLVGSFTTRTKSSFGELRGKVEELYSTGLANLTGAASAIKGTLEGLIASHVSSSQLISSFLESTLSTVIPSCSNALAAVSSEIGKNAQKMMVPLSKKNEALLSALTTKAANKVSSSFPALEKEVGGILERILASNTPAPIAESSSKPTTRKTASPGRKTALSAEAKEIIKGFERKLIDELKEYLEEEASTGHTSFEEEAKKLQTEIRGTPFTSLKAARQGLGQSEVIAASLLPKFAEYSQSIESLGKQVEDFVDVSARQYAGEAEIAKKALNDLLLRNEEALGGTLKKVTEGIGSSKASRTKQIATLVSEAQNTIGSASAKHLDELDEQIQQSKSGLLALVNQATKKSDTAKSSAQSSIANQVSTTLGTCKEITESTTNSMRAAMISVSQEFDAQTSALQKDLGSFIAQSTDEIKAFVEESASRVAEFKENQSKQIDLKLDKAVKELGDFSNKQVSTAIDTTSAMNTSLSKLTNASLGEFKSEVVGGKDRFHRVISSHLQDYEQEAFGASGTCGYLLSRSYEKYREVSMVNEKNHSDALLTHQTRYENSMNTAQSGLVGCIDKNEALLKEETKRILGDFRDSIEKHKKASASVEWILQSAWMALERAPQFSESNTWPVISRTALAAHLQDMIKRTKSHIAIALPTLAEAPLEDLQKVKKATRVTLLIGESKGDEKQEQLLAGLSKMGNVSIRASGSLSYFGCSKDSEEILFAPIAQKENDTIGIVSVEDGYIELFEKLVLPALLAPSYDLKESAKQQSTPKKTQE